MSPDTPLLLGHAIPHPLNPPLLPTPTGSYPSNRPTQFRAPFTPNGPDSSVVPLETCQFASKRDTMH